MTQDSSESLYMHFSRRGYPQGMEAAVAQLLLAAGAPVPTDAPDVGPGPNQVHAHPPNTARHLHENNNISNNTNSLAQAQRNGAPESVALVGRLSVDQATRRSRRQNEGEMGMRQDDNNENANPS